MADARFTLGSLMALLSGTCRHCGCHGDSCAIGGGEKCGWCATEIERTLCTAPGCVMKEFYRKEREKREAKRKAEEAERVARIPFWIRQRNAANKKSGQKRKRRKLKARAA
jgi:hypothetical protein